MRLDKKLLRLKISRPLYENLKKSAEDSRRPFVHELALRIEYGLDEFENNFERIKQPNKISCNFDDQVIQLYLSTDIHTKLKTMASNSKMFLMDLISLILFDSGSKIKSIANPQNVIWKLN